MASTRPNATNADISITERSYVDWNAVFAGAVIASAYALIMLTFGSAVGLSLTSPFSGEGASASLTAIAAGLWMLWVQVSAFGLGGYVAGRLRAPAGDASPSEIEMRDGAHGLLVWGLGIIIGALLAAGLAGSAVQTAARVAAPAIANAVAGSPSSAVLPAGETPELIAARLLRPSAPPYEGTNPNLRQDVTQVVESALASNSISNIDRAYLVSAIASQTQLSVEDARTRVDVTIANALEAKRRAQTQAEQTAEAARKTAIVIAFITAVSLLVSGVAAWWAADVGGKHRSEGYEFGPIMSWSTEEPVRKGKRARA